MQTFSPFVEGPYSLIVPVLVLTKKAGVFSTCLLTKYKKRAFRKCVIILCADEEIQQVDLEGLAAAVEFSAAAHGPRGVTINAPPPWEEVSQEQLSRRQPQHLQQPIKVSIGRQHARKNLI